MELAILVVGVGAVAVWFFMSKDGGLRIKPISNLE